MSDTAVLSPPAEKPAHVPDALVFDFDYHHDAALKADPHKRLLEINEQAPPIFWTPRQGGAWVLRSHNAVYKASRDVEMFSSEFVPQEKIKAMMAAMPPGSPHIPQPIPINIDPPAHGIYRAPLQKVFSPRAILALKDGIRTLAGELIDEVKDKGGCEFMAAIAEPLPVQVFLKMLGLPLERLPLYRAVVTEHLAQTENEPAKVMQRLMKITGMMRDIVLDRKENPRDDILSMLWQTEIEGKPTTLEDIENYAVLLFIAGLDTVVNGMGHGIRHLAGDLELQRKLRAEPKLVPEAGEELLRRYTFTVPVRKVAKDAEFEGVAMKKGEMALVFLPAADLDAAEFPNPEVYDLDRENNVHIAFGVGPHRCLGSHLARVELQVLYEEMLARLPEFRLDPANPPSFHGGNVIGVDKLHLLWDA